MPPATPPPVTTPPEKPKSARSWTDVQGRARTIASIAALFLCLVTAGAVAGYIYSQQSKKPVETKPVTVENLSTEELKKLTEIGANLGTAGQILNIAADSLFRGKVDIGGDLSIGGRLNANGPVTLSQLNITGTTAATGLNVGSNLIVGGTATMQRNLVVAGLTTIGGGLNVAGASSMSSLNVSTISVQTISIAGPLTIGHLRTQGTAPTISAGNAVGGGGTVNISGNDTAGTVNVNTGGGAPAGVLATINFRANYTSGVHVLLSPITGPAASTPVYVTRNAAGFQLRSDTPPPSGSVLSFDYFVTQ